MLQVLGTVDGRWWLGGCRLSEPHGQCGQRKFPGKIQVGPKGRKVSQAKIWGEHLGRRHVGPWQVLEKEVGMDGSQETRADGDHGWRCRRCQETSLTWSRKGFSSGWWRQRCVDEDGGGVVSGAGLEWEWSGSGATGKGGSIKGESEPQLSSSGWGILGNKLGCVCLEVV